MNHDIESLTRRHFCKTVLAGATVAASGVGASHLRAAERPEPHQAFASSFDNVPESFGPTLVTFDRPLPDALRGTLYRNGPARMQRGDTRYHHWFDGDGMVHSFDLNGDSLLHRARMVDTERSIKEAAAGRFLRDGFGTAFTDSQPISGPDDLNVANISVLPLGDEVLALWEAGSAWRLDADTLDTLGRKVFTPDTDGLPFSAHPRTDPTGRIWNFGYLSGSGKLILYDIEADGRLNRVSIIDAPNADMVHDFAITDRYLVFVLQPLFFREAGSSPIAFADRLQWDADQPVHVLVIDKQNLQIAHRFELPAFFAFHMGNAWQDGANIRIEVATATEFRPLMQQIVQASTAQPLSGPPSAPNTLEIVLDTRRRRATIESLPGTGVDFPRFDQRFTGQQTNQLFMLGRSAQMSNDVFGFNRVCRIDRDSLSETIFDYGAYTIAEEHIFVPAPGGQQGEGWLVGTSYQWQQRQTMLSVFNAQQIEDGPIAQCQLPYALPLGLHGQFVQV